jgi:L-rhamnose-H+ transport protein
LTEEEIVDTAVIVGFAYLLLGAVCGGSFGLPSKYVRKDTPWENLWGPFFLLVTIAMPFLLGPLLVKGFFAVYGAVGVMGLLAPLGFGLLWGAGSMTLGMSFAFIGLSLAYSLNYGAQIIFGAITPMVLHHGERVLTLQGGVVLLGVAVCVAGVVVAGRAGILKDRSVKKDDPQSSPPQGGAGQPKMLAGLVLAIVSGLLCGCYGVAASFTGPVAKAAEEQFANEAWRVSCATTAVILWGGAVSSCLYCAMRLTRNGTWTNFTGPGTGLVLAVALVMALLHNGALFFFNLGFPRLGDMGVSVGYASFMSFAIIVGNVHGFRTGEWQGASRQSIRWILAGIAILIVGVCILATGNGMGQP